MNSLVQILDNANQSGEIKPVETSIFDILYGLSELINGPDNTGGNNSVSAYIEGVGEFAKGLQDGYKIGAEEINDESTPYNYGHTIGYETRSGIKEAVAKKIEIISYENFFDRLKEVMSTIDTELRKLPEPTNCQYDLLIEQITLNSAFHNETRINLVRLLEQYRPSIEQLLSESLDGGFVKELERSKKYTVERFTLLGLIYMFRDDPNSAYESFNQARELMTSDENNYPVFHVALDAFQANSIFQEAYSKVKLMQDSNTPELELPS